MSYEPKDFLVWGELPVSNLQNALSFYGQVTGADLSIDENGPNPVVMFRPKNAGTGVALHLYPGKPAIDGRGPTLHLAAEGKVEEIMDRVTSAGGRIASEVIQIPAGRFFYASDPDGNSVGFFEMAA